MQKVCKKTDIQNLFHDGMTLMISGFMGCGTPETLVDLLMELNIRDITLIATDTALVGKGIGKLVVNGQIKKLYASHIGLNPETGRRMNEGLMEVELVPQGTLVERIRAGGAGIGGFLTPTGVGTIVEEGKEKMNINGKDYILELPLRADVALVRGSVVDAFGNAMYKGTTNNFNQVMATAADTVVMEAEKLVSIGEIPHEAIATPGIFVDYIIVGGESNGK